MSAPPSIARSTAAAISGSTSAKLGRRRLARAVGAGLEDRAHRARQRPARSGAARARSRLRAAGERIATLGVGDDGRHGPRQQQADRVPRARAERAEQLAQRERAEVEDGRGLAVVAALDLVDALDRGRVERIAGEPVEAVGRKQGDAAGGDRALERAPAPAPPRRSRRRSSPSLEPAPRRRRSAAGRRGRRGSRPGRSRRARAARRPPRPGRGRSRARPRRP